MKYRVGEPIKCVGDIGVIFIKGKWYKIDDYNDDNIFVISEYGSKCGFTIDVRYNADNQKYYKFDEGFITIREMRKNKLKKLNESDTREII